MADIFVSYTISDREWAYWIAKELEALGHTPHVHEWEVKPWRNGFWLASEFS
jgi:TIR domain